MIRNHDQMFTCHNILVSIGVLQLQYSTLGYVLYVIFPQATHKQDIQKIHYNQDTSAHVNEQC